VDDGPPPLPTAPAPTAAHRRHRAARVGCAPRRAVGACLSKR